MRRQVTPTVRVLNTSQPSMSSEAKLDLILEQLKALGPMQATLESLWANIRDVKEEMHSLQFEVNGHGDRLDTLEREMQEQKDVSNQQQQQLHSLTLRLLNLPVVPGEGDDNNAGLRARVYDSVLKPLLVAAKAAKDLASVPQATTVIEACFRPFNATQAQAKPDDPPPHVIITITSKPIKIALLKQRKNLPKPTGDSKRFILVEDLTPATHKMLTAISKSKAASKVWTIDGNIKYTMEGSNTVRTVKSVYDPLAKIIGK